MLKSTAVLHPIRSRIFLALHRGSKTAQELCESLSDVPAGSVYRHINILLDADMIVIAEEVKSRGPAIRKFSIPTVVPFFDDQDREAMDAEATVMLLQTLLTSIEQKGQAFAANAEYPLKRGVMSMVARTAHLTEDEHQALREAILKALESPRRENTEARFIGYFSLPEGSDPENS
jgi:DNA-binding transcriptional ArsR family regulator